MPSIRGRLTADNSVFGHLTIIIPATWFPIHLLSLVVAFLQYLSVTQRSIIRLISITNLSILVRNVFRHPILSFFEHHHRKRPFFAEFDSYTTFPSLIADALRESNTSLISG